MTLVPLGAYLRISLLCALIPTYLLAAKPRNVVIFVSDDHGLEMGAYGNPVVQTPNMDALARDGTRYTRAFATAASCSPSRATILSGLQVHAHGQYGLMHNNNNSRAFDGLLSLPHILSAHGYTTARIGKYHIAPESIFHFVRELPLELPGWDRSVVTMAENCREIIADDSRAFFLYFATSDPHRSPVTDTALPGRPNLFGNETTYPGIKEVHYDPREVIVPPFLPDTLETRAEIAQYYQAVSRIDQGLGRLVSLLKEYGQYENTLIIYMSDNGIAMPGAKTNLYEPGIRLPLLVHSPDARQRGVVSDAMVSWVDITPTVLDFAGIHEVLAPKFLAGLDADLKPRSTGPDVPYRFQGRSFLSTLEEPHSPDWNVIYGSHIFHEITMYYPMRMIRTERYKLIHNLASPLPFPIALDLFRASLWQTALRDESPSARFGRRSFDHLLHRVEYELYDLETDPDEITNLAADPDHAEVRQDLETRLRDFQAATQDPWFPRSAQH